MRELRLVTSPSLTVSATVINSQTGAESSVSLTESPAGYYVGNFPAVSAGTYDIAFTSGSSVIGAETVVWNGTAGMTVTASDLETFIGASGLSVTIQSPVATDGSITIQRGDDLKAADGRAIVFLFTGVPDLTGATVRLNAFRVFDRYQQFSIVGIATSPSTNPTISFDVPSEITILLNVGDPGYEYAVTATLANGDIVTLQTGDLEITE